MASRVVVTDHNGVPIGEAAPGYQYADEPYPHTGWLGLLYEPVGRAHRARHGIFPSEVDARAAVTRWHEERIHGV